MFYKPGERAKTFTRIVCNVFETFEGFYRPFFSPLAKTVAMSRIEVVFRLDNSDVTGSNDGCSSGSSVFH